MSVPYFIQCFPFNIFTLFWIHAAMLLNAVFPEPYPHLGTRTRRNFNTRTCTQLKIYHGTVPVPVPGFIFYTVSVPAPVPEKNFICTRVPDPSKFLDGYTALIMLNDSLHFTWILYQNELLVEKNGGYFPLNEI